MGPILRNIDRFERLLSGAEAAIAAAALVAIMVAVNVNVVSRFFDLRILDLSEVALSAMLPLTFIGAALCTAIREHIRLDLVDAVPDMRLRQALEIAADIAFVAFMVGGGVLMLIHSLFSIVRTAAKFGDR